MVRLYARELGGSAVPPLAILHGLLGSSRNWQGAGVALAPVRRVLALDLRNHGDSPSGPMGDLDALADDVAETLDHLGVRRAALLGHSLGGKVAMRLACRANAHIDRLVVVDIAPRDYPASATEVQALRELDLARLASRRDAEDALAPAIPSRATRQFLLANLARTDDGWRWRVDLDAIAAGLGSLRRAPLADDARYTGPVLWITGERSRYTAETDLALMRHHFPHVVHRVIAGAGHNPHTEAKPAFVETVLAFLA